MRFWIIIILLSFFWSSKTACGGLDNNKGRIKELLRNYDEQFQVVEETRWHKTYKKSRTVQSVVSKFMLGEASITLEELKNEWCNWSQAERVDFSMNVYGASEHKLPELYVFLAKNGSWDVRSLIALQITVHLPEEQALNLLKKWCGTCPLGEGINIVQALARIKDDIVDETIRKRLKDLIDAPTFDRVSNSFEPTDTAREALACVKYLLELGVNQDSLVMQIDTLKNHPSPRIQLNLKKVLAGCPCDSDSGEGKALR